MRIILWRISVIFFSAALLSGCKKNSTISENQTVLFGFEHISYTLNYNHYGFYIDSEGNVLTYNNPESWRFPDSELRISEQDLAENLSMCTFSGIRIPRQELQKYAVHIKHLASTRVTAIKNVAEDAGSSEYICYQYSENTGTYKGTIIKMEGDFTCENLNFFSKKVADWLKSINTSLRKK